MNMHGKLIFGVKKLENHFAIGSIGSGPKEEQALFIKGVEAALVFSSSGCYIWDDAVIHDWLWQLPDDAEIEPDYAVRKISHSYEVGALSLDEEGDLAVYVQPKSIKIDPGWFSMYQRKWVHRETGVIFPRWRVVLRRNNKEPCVLFSWPLTSSSG